LIDVHSHLSQRATANLSFKDNVLLIVFHLEGDVRIMDVESSHDAGLKLQRGEHKFEIFNANNLKIIYEPALMLNSFIVVLSPEFIHRIIPHNYSNQDDLIKAVMDGDRISLPLDFAPLSLDMKQIIEKVRNCSRKGSFHRLCLEIKIAELLMLQLEQQASWHSEQLARPAMHDADIEKIAEAKNIMEDQSIPPSTIKDPAGMVRINEPKLKTNFTYAFHSSM